jgi:hypothetical protein
MDANNGVDPNANMPDMPYMANMSNMPANVSKNKSKVNRSKSVKTKSSVNRPANMPDDR